MWSRTGPNREICTMITFLRHSYGILVGGLAFIMGFSPLLSQDDSGFDKLKEIFEVEVKKIEADAEKGINDGISKYQVQISALHQRAMAKGDLDLVRQYQEELERFESGLTDIKSLGKSSLPEVERWREALQTVVGQVTEYRDRRIATLIRQFQPRLKPLRFRLVQEGRLDQAELVDQEMKRLSEKLRTLEVTLKLGPEGRNLPISLERELVARYGFTTKEGGHVADETGRGYDGAVQGAEWTEHGKIGGAYRFDGIDDRINITKELPDSSTFTVSAWVKYQGQGADGGIFSDYDGRSGNDVMFSLTGPGSVHIRADKNGAKLKSHVSFTRELTEDWHHIVWTMTPSKSTVFLDGKPTGEVRDKGSNFGNHGAYIGFSNDGSQWTYFKGFIDELMIWNRALSESEVRDLYDLHR